MKKRLLWVFVVGVLAAGLIMGFQFYSRHLVALAVREVAGAPAQIGYFRLDLLGQKVSIKDFVLYNPPGFPEAPLIDIPEVTVAIKSQSLLQKKIQLPLVVVNLKEMHVVKNSEGQLNVESLNFVKNAASQPSRPDSSAQKAEQLPFHIERLQLTVGRVVYTEFVAGRDPRVTTYDINIKGREYRDIKSPHQLASLILFETMTPTAIRSVAVGALSTVMDLKSLTVNTATGLLNRVIEKLK